MVIHSGSSLGTELPYELVGCEDLQPAAGTERAWYSPSHKILVVELGGRRYETITNVEPDAIARRASASRNADARYLEASSTPTGPHRRKRRPG